ncbi:MAG: hypothetical protein ACK4MV_09765 [Beijerinckiaceae bacterium]
MSQHTASTFLDRTGREVVSVRLSNHPDRATLFMDDYVALRRRFGDAPWWVRDNGSGTLYVTVKDAKTRRAVTVARYVVGNDRRTAVQYADGDRLNLRSTNLMVVSGNGGISKKRRRKAPKVSTSMEPGSAAASAAPAQAPRIHTPLLPHHWRNRQRRNLVVG